jgi:hypothetical protein
MANLNLHDVVRIEVEREISSYGTNWTEINVFNNHGEKFEIVCFNHRGLISMVDVTNKEQAA